jgi:pimeloyl-ACP methyl ester carboxylesterase
MNEEIIPFTIAVSDEVLADLRKGISRTRLPDALPDTGWNYGTDIGYLEQLLTYWRDKYDWRAHEVQLNRHPQFLTTINGLSLHFLHARSPHPGAMPLIMTHGWPSSTYEFDKVIGPLTDPTRHGGDPGDAFHVVCPSIPGYAWSQAPNRPGFGADKVAETNIELMRRLGYERYGVQGGDWGARISATVGKLVPHRVVGVHLLSAGFLPVPEGPDARNGLSDTEIADIAWMHAFRAEASAYAQVQATRPLTLSYGLSDSPAGLAAWIVEKFQAWSDCGGDVETSFTRDELLTNITIYWVTNCIGSSVRLYKENRNKVWSGRVEVPTACAIFPKELSKYPRSWVDPYINVTRWSQQARGGHFAAFEVPGLFVEDVREFFRDLR